MDLRKQEGVKTDFYRLPRGNYLPESSKNKAMVLTFNDKQEFENTGRSIDKSNVFSKIKIHRQ